MSQTEEEQKAEAKRAAQILFEAIEINNIDIAMALNGMWSLMAFYAAHGCKHGVEFALKDMAKSYKRFIRTVRELEKKHDC